MAKRYTYRYADDGDLYRHEEPDGKYVLHADYAALLARHNALYEAVAWERECYAIWEYGPTKNLSSTDEAIDAMHAARAEVDRLLKEPTP